ncbi:hypothetical protein LZ30DRAFT_766227 [Colletotrichum cereale]|nr:hypothetical protein LZ30DRAFT_766227 [Colletotrichum cereale]
MPAAELDGESIATGASHGSWGVAIRSDTTSKNVDLAHILHQLDDYNQSEKPRIITEVFREIYRMLLQTLNEISAPIARPDMSTLRKRAYGHSPRLASIIAIGVGKASSTTSYGDTREEKGVNLCELEARQLVRIANAEGPVKLQGEADVLGLADTNGYFRLRWQRRRLTQVLQTCEHETARRGYCVTSTLLSAKRDVPGPGSSGKRGPREKNGSGNSRKHQLDVLSA